MLDEILSAIKGQYQPSLVIRYDVKGILATGAHVAEDVVSESASAGTCWTFKNCVRKKGGAGKIVGGLVVAETTNIGGWFSLLLHTKTPTAVLNDGITNTAPILADREAYIGRINFNACTDLGTGSQDANSSVSTFGGLPIHFVCEDDDVNLYAIAVIRNAVDLADNTWLKFAIAIEQY